MTQVQISEIVEALKDAVNTENTDPYWPKYFTELAERIEAHGIAPPDGMILMQEQTIIDCIEIAMDNCGEASIPECGDFGLIAQYLAAEYPNQITLTAAPKQEVKP